MLSYHCIELFENISLSVNENICYSLFKQNCAFILKAGGLITGFVFSRHLYVPAVTQLPCLQRMMAIPITDRAH